MKKIMFHMLAICVMVGMAAASDAKTASKDAKGATVKGWISEEHCAEKHAKEGGEACVKKCAAGGSKLALVSDGDNKVWTIDNADAVKGHEGHHVSITGHPNTATKSIHVMEVAMLGKDMKEDAKEMKHDEKAAAKSAKKAAKKSAKKASTEKP